MPLDKDYLTYSHRQRGMDHDLYEPSNLFKRQPITWPDGKPVALWLTVSLEFFPLTPNDGPFRAPGHMVTPFPDYRTFTTRDYGNRVGIYRILRELEHADLPATAFINSALFGHAAPLMADLKAAGWEFAAHGVDMNHLHVGGMDEMAERGQIQLCLDRFATANISPRGWLSPGRSHSTETLRLLADAGLAWTGDWDNDDMPYVTKSGIVAMPYTEELQDRKCLVTLGQREDIWRDQILTAARWLADEASTHGGRILHIALTPYVIGQPFRIQILRETLGALTQLNICWPATAQEILERWRAQSA